MIVAESKKICILQPILIFIFLELSPSVLTEYSIEMG